MSTFVFPGQGSQHKGMGKDLFARYPDILAAADRVLGYSMKELCLDDPKGLLNDTQFTQPALYVVNALNYFDSIGSNGTRPDYLAGHSLGEYDALLAAGVVDFETGLRLVQKRGELMAKVKGGGMAAVIGLSDKEIERILLENSFTSIDIANRNTPSQLVISGLIDEIQKAKAALESAGAKLVVPLRVSAPFHSRHMANARKEFAEFLRSVRFSPPRIPVISNVEARPYPVGRIRELLAAQITSSVRWTETIQYLMAVGETDFVEVGPGTVLGGLIRKIQQEAEPLKLEEERQSSPEQPEPLMQAEPAPQPVEGINPEGTVDHPAYTRDGVYVVIGGAGGIGMVWSEYVIRNYAARTIWIGRRPLNDEIQANMDLLGKLGPRPMYIAADATNRAALQSAYEEIKRLYPRINGIVHAAIVLQDQSLAKMDEDVFRAGLSAKVDVSVRMAQVFATEPLDFVLFFSSINAFGKSAGQSNYAAGCTFKDAFAQKLAADWRCAVKVINWGYWGSVGITSSDAYRQRMAKLGIGSIESAEGMQALETLFSSPVTQLAMLKVTKPITVAGMNLSESIEDSTRDVPSFISVVTHKKEERELAASSALREQRQQVEALLHRLLWVQLQALAKRDEKSWDLGEWSATMGVRSGYNSWLEESIEALCRAGILSRAGTQIDVLETTPVTSESVWRDWENLKGKWGDQEDSRAQLTLVETTLRALPDVLVGKRRATEVMFPNASLELVGAIYKHNRVADHFNDVLTDAVEAYVEARIQRDSTTRIRILEIGAGTGGTTATVLKRLEPFTAHLADYCYTDISKAFLIHGERTYGSRNAFMTFKIFNVESDPAAQDLLLGNYDLVIAANVLHATARMRQTLRHAKALLHRNGLLLLNELSENSLFLHLTFGLLEGWWLYKDPVLRIKGTPALSPDTWKRVLEDEGFPSIAFTASEVHDFGQQIIVAESDGRIRRQLNRARPEASVGKAFPKLSARLEPIRSETSQPRPVQEATGSSLRERAGIYFKKAIGDTLKIPTHKISSSEPLERYGIDSINIVELTNTLQTDLGEIDSTLFFEYQTIDALVGYFLDSRRETLVRLLGDNEHPSRTTEPSLSKEPKVPAISVPSRLRSPKSIPGQHSLTPLDPIAIIGIAGRYPQAENLSEFWDVLRKGKNCIGEIPRERWPWEKYFGPEQGKWRSIYTKWGGFLKDIDKFDPLFFQISPVDAKRMDPQERLFLEIAYACIEDAGYTPSRLCKSRKIGVFAGVTSSTYRTDSAYWSIANRVSYLFDFQGPSMAIDTACSSSLTAVHLAVESLHSGTSECAIAGGVNLIIDPIHYFGLSLARMLTPSDKCKPFGDQADGFVDGEGVGAVVLKPLKKAVADGDHIYGIIRGTGVNSGGKTNGYTVPNPNAQFQLVVDALRTANVHPRTVSYIEAHGTGTILGDPIEIAGLRRAFEQQTDDKGFCSIGSVKSNIGHGESAAGIAGITKVLLQMQHGKLVPSLHSETLNPKIRFDETPFVVQQKFAEWRRPSVTLNGESREYPRIAGISSFGAGGANAHIIIEEFLDQSQTLQQPHVLNEPDVLILLSARNEEGLKRVTAKLRDFLKDARRRNSPLQLADLAFTLQVGRVAMDERLATMVRSLVELEELLERLTTGQVDVDGVYRGRAKRSAEAASLFAGDEELDEAIDKWLRKRKLSKLMELWLLGVDVDWNRLYPEGSPRRIALPTYPFARERHWLEDAERKEIGASISSYPTRLLHPLLHENTSTFSEQRFTTTFTGEEPFLTDHRVQGHRVLPGVAHLEMARAGIEQSSQIQSDDAVLVMRNVVWLRPVLVSGGERVHLGLTADEDGRIGYEVYGEPAAEGGDGIVYSRGTVLLRSWTEPPRLDLPALESRCGGGSLGPAECYAIYSNLGIDYGPAHRGIEKIHVGTGEVLAKLRLSTAGSSGDEKYVLHPGMMDSALQASIGIFAGEGDEKDLSSVKPSLPFALDELEVFGRSTPVLWAHIRASAGSRSGGKVRKLDIDVCDEGGNVCARLKGLSSRELTGEMTLAASTSVAPVDLSNAPDRSTPNEPVHTERPATTTSQSLEDHVRNTIVRQLCESLALAETGVIDLDDSFADYGLDSITGTQVVQQINQALKIELNVTALFDYTSVNRLAAYIVTEHRHEMAGPSEPVSPPLEVKDTVTPSLLVEPPNLRKKPPFPGVIDSRSDRKKSRPRDEKRTDFRESLQKEPIAIIGMSGRFAKSRSLDQLWKNLAAGSDLIEEVTRWDLASEYAAEAAHKDGCRYGGLLEDIDQFDPMFFNISPTEATYMDPQQRLFLEESWRAMEDAGYAGQGTDGLSCGVYVGCGSGDYFRLFEGTLPAQAFWGNVGSVIPARIAYYMNLQGPAIAIDTACSSSLVAIHMACQGLWSGETEMALAGGVFIQSTSGFYLLANRAGMLSPSGRCHTFDSSADGFVPAEGVGVLVLKRLSEAIADGDHIYGVIRGSGINQDGKTNGITAPSSKSQERLERQVYESFQVNPENIQMVEAHGTGTRLGDPIEFEALTRAFRKDTDKRQYCAIGSIKTNIGHAATAAGVAGVMRVLLSFQHKQIPPSLHFANGNERIRFDESPFYVNAHLKDWDVAPGENRCAAVSSFGFSGTNAHMVLEEAPAVERGHDKLPAYLIVLSARTKEQLRQQADQLIEYSSVYPNMDCGNVSYTLLLGRKHLSHRLAVVVRDADELIAALKAWSTNGKSSKVQVSDLGHSERHEPTTLKRYGNECIGKVNDAQGLDEFQELIAVVADLYLQGYQLDYHNLFAGGYSRIALPTYPFSPEKYWIPLSSTQGDKHVTADAVSESIVHRQRTIVASSLRVNSSARNETPAAAPQGETFAGTVTLLPVWDRIVIDPRTRPAITAPDGTDRVAVIGAAAGLQGDIRSVLPAASFLAVDAEDTVERIQSLLETGDPISHIFWIAPRYAAASIFDEAIIEQQDKTIFTGFRLIKALLALGYGTRDLTWTVVTRNCQPVLAGEDLSPVHAGLHGLIGSMAQEYANWHIRLVDLGDDDVWPLDDTFRLQPDPRGAAWACRGDEWYRRHLLPCRDLHERQVGYRDAGVYVVIGGAGGIGQILSEFLIRHYHARVIWIGRRTQDAEISGKLERLSAVGAPPIYISADASNPSEMASAYKEIKKRYSAINGVIHSAVGVFDQRLAEMTEDRFEQGLSAKIDVSIRIAQVFREEPLDFLVFFSSIDSLMTSHGKASYAAGCAFMDAYAYQLSRELLFPVKVMNWGYWGEVGAGSVVPETVKNRLARWGMGVIQPEEGLKALSSLLSGPFNQLVFVRTTKPISKEILGNSDTVSVAQYRSEDVVEDVVRMAAQSISGLPMPRRTEDDENRKKLMEDLLARLLLCQIESTGWWHEKLSTRFPRSELHQKSGAYGRWLDESIAVLCARGYVDADGTSFAIVHSQSANADQLWNEWDAEKKFWAQEPSTRALVELVEKTVQALPDILAGRQSATQVMFPDSSMKLVEGIYKHNAIADYFNDVVSSLVVAYVEGRIRKDPKAAIRIFEIGAGTGGVSAGIFEKLQPFKSQIREYCFTDLSKAFLIHGQREYFQANPYLTFKIFDVEHPERAWDIDAGRYDLVIASNVLHATKNIGQSVRNAKALLQENGLILLNEISDKSLFSHLTFGLLEGWWLAEDPQVRIPGCPGLTPQSWKHVLEQEGFDSISFPGIHAHDLGQQIVVGSSNGVLRSGTAVSLAIVPTSGSRPSSDRQSANTTAGSLKRIISRVTQLAAEDLQMQLTWTELGLDSILAMQVIQEIESEFGLRLYPNELIEHDTIEKLLSFLTVEIENKRRADRPQKGSETTTSTEPRAFVSAAAALPKTQAESQAHKIAFIFSTPRAGSTLLRVMLAGHHQLLSPPELHLLTFSTFGEREAVLKANNQQFLGEGLIKTLCEVKGIAVEAARAITATWASENVSIKDVYAELQSFCPEKVLVDKSPSYANDVSILRRAEALGAMPFYIHLVRHPLAVMESFVRNRFDKLLSVKEDPWLFAERLWHRYNANLDTFLAEIPPDRWMRIRYEDLVAQPLPVTMELCRRLGLDFDARVLEPYEGDRMTSGLHGVSLPLSDPNFKNHNKIESDLGTAWTEQLDKVAMLGEDTVRLAETYGYRFVRDKESKLLPAQEAFLRRFSESPVWNIVQSVKLGLDSALDIHRFRSCMQQAVAKHASLRNSFKRVNDSWLQEEGDSYSVPVLQIDGSGLNGEKLDELVEVLRNDLYSCIDIHTRVNLSCGVVDLGNLEYEFILVAHHLVADGVSMLKLQRDLLESYRGSEVAVANVVPDIQMYTYLAELERSLTPELLREHKQSWQDHIDSARYRLPADIQRDSESVDSVAAESEYRLRLPMSSLGWLAGRPRAEFFLFLGGALYRCLSEWTGLPDIAVAHRLHRRNIGSDHDFSDVVGWFAGDVPVKITVNPNDSLNETAAAFRQQFASIPMGGVSYEILANAGEIPHCHEVCPVRLNYFPGNRAMNDVEIDFQKFEPASHERLYALDLIVSTYKEECVFVVRYSTESFTEAAMAQLVERWVGAFHSKARAALAGHAATSPHSGSTDQRP